MNKSKLQSLDLMQPCYLEGVSFVSLNLKQYGYANSNRLGALSSKTFLRRLIQVWVLEREVPRIS